MRKHTNRGRLWDLSNVLLAVLVMGVVFGCSPEEEEEDDNVVAITLEVRLQNADGTPVEAPDVGGILIEFTVATLDAARTSVENESGGCRAWVHGMGGNKYRLLRIMPAGQNRAELVGFVRIEDSEQAVTGAQIIQICNHANQPLVPGDYKIVIQ